MLGSLVGPLMVSRRLLGDLEAISEAVRGLPSFERTLITRLDDLHAELKTIRAELIATNAITADLRDQVADAVEHLPGHDSDDDSRGPIARARDAISGQAD